MKQSKNNLKLLLVSSTFFFVFFFIAIPQAHASSWDDIVSGMHDIVSIVKEDILTPAQNTICSVYSTSVANGSLKEGTLLFSVEQHICSSISTLTSSVKQITTVVPVINPITESSLVPVAKVAQATSSTTTPSALISGVADEGNTLTNAEILYWTNINRVSQGTGLGSLTEKATLDKIAEIRVKDMFAKGYFEHTSPTGDNVSKEADANGYSYITIGENIALGNFGSSRDLLVAWMNSPGHRANILNGNYTEIGIAAIEGNYNGQDVWIAAQIFGRPLSDCSEPDTSLKSKITTGTTQASSMLANVQALKTKISSFNPSNILDYNTLANQYNTAAQAYNDLVNTLKQETATYNSEAATFNTCIKTK